MCKEYTIHNFFSLPSIAFVATFTRFDHSKEAGESTNGIRELGGGGTNLRLDNGEDAVLSLKTRGESLQYKKNKSKRISYFSIKYYFYRNKESAFTFFNN